MEAENVVFFNDTTTTEIYTLSLHDALPILHNRPRDRDPLLHPPAERSNERVGTLRQSHAVECPAGRLDRKSTRLNSSHANISYAVFCLKKNKKSSNFSTLPPSLPSTQSDSR